MNQIHLGSLALLVGSVLLASACPAQNAAPTNSTNGMTNTARARRGGPPPETTPQAPEVLPGKGLAQHDFMYAGESFPLRIRVFRGGKLAWDYTHPATRGEISDAMMLANGDVLFAHQFGVTEVSPDKKVVWNYDPPAGDEIHTAQAIGKDHVVFIENGKPAKLKVVNKTSGAVVKEFELPVGNTNAVHTQFRHARLTPRGTILVGHLDMGKICEYDANGKEVFSLPFQSPWTVDELKNGNILVTRESSFVRELTHTGDVAWEFRKTNMPPEIKIANMQFATRLANGNTIINSWRQKGNGTAIQAFEVSPDKQLVWALRSWEDPDLGPSTIIQVLDEPGAAENVHFGDIH